MGDGPLTAAAMSRGSITGVVGRITWAHYTAAQLEGYTVTRSPDNVWQLRATVVLADDFKMAQRPLMFVALHRMGGTPGEWRWPIQDVTMHDGGTVTARLGPPEE